MPSAIKQHGVKKLQKFEELLQSLTIDLRFEQFRLQTILEKLLRGLVSSDEIRLMIAAPPAELWRRKYVQKQLRARVALDPTLRLFFDPTTLELTIAAMDKAQLVIDTQKNASGFRDGFLFQLNCKRIEQWLVVVHEGVSRLSDLTKFI